MTPPTRPTDDASFDALLRHALRAALDQMPAPASSWASLQARLAHALPATPERSSPDESQLLHPGIFPVEWYEWSH